MHVELTLEAKVGAGAMGEYVVELIERGAQTILIKVTPELEELLRKKREDIENGRQDSV